VNDPVSHNRKCALLNTAVFGWQFPESHCQYYAAAAYVFPSQTTKRDKKIRIWDKM